MRRFENRLAVVSGGASGIGYASADRLASEGAHVVILDINDEMGQAGAEAIRRTGARADYFHCNVADEAAVDEMMSRIGKDIGLVRVAVNSAYKHHLVDFFELTSAQLQLELDVNLKGPFYVSQRAARALVARGESGAIVNITSVAAAVASGNQVPYSASKAGLTGLTKAMAIALAPMNIRVNAVAPGPTITPTSEKGLNLPNMKEAQMLRVPLGRFAHASEQASAVAFLASDDASFVTGHTIFVDGGRMALNHTMKVQQANPERT